VVDHVGVDQLLEPQDVTGHQGLHDGLAPTGVGAGGVAGHSSHQT
jgi:hypothetical protein